MSHGRTYWWCKDAGWWRREWIVELGEEFGADGPAVIDWLACEAKAQNDGGLVSAGIKTVSRGCFVDPVTASHVVSRAVTLGLLEEYEDRQGRFTCRISGWRLEQERHAAAERKANQRARQSTGTDNPTPNVTSSHAESQPVTAVPKSHPTGEDRTGTDNANALSVTTREVQDLFDHWRVQCGHPTAKLTADRRAKLKARLKEGYTPDQIRQAINGAARGAYVNDAGVRFDDLELICRTGSKLEDFIGRASAGASVPVSDLDRKRLEAIGRLVKNGEDAA